MLLLLFSLQDLKDMPEDSFILLGSLVWIVFSLLFHFPLAVQLSMALLDSGDDGAWFQYYKVTLILFETNFILFFFLHFLSVSKNK